MTEPIDSPLFEAIGRLTVSWSFVESGVDYSVILLHSNFGGNEIEPDMPWSLKRKLDYIKKCFRRIDRLQPSSEPACSLMNKVRDASELRHDLIHGVAIEQPEGATQIDMVRLLRGRNGVEERRITVNLPKILDAAGTANALGRNTLQMARWLLDTSNNKANETVGKL